MSHYNQITIEEFKEALPAHIRKNVNPPLLDQINSAVQDAESLAVFRENVMGFTTVLKEGRFKIVDYLYAVKFVSHKLLGDNNITAWSKTFPDRYKKMIAANKDRSEIAAVASRFNSSKLVVLITAQAMVPTHILNAPLYQEAINAQATLMRTANSEKVRCEAANSLMAALKPPETQKLELDIVAREDESIKELREATMELAREQRKLIAGGGATAKSVAESRIIPVDAEVVNE